MWTDADIDHWIGRLYAAQGLGYVAARVILIDLRDRIGEATVTEAHKHGHARYLARKSKCKLKASAAHPRG